MMPPRRDHAAFSLVEVTLALGVAGFALIAIFGLLPVGQNSNQVAIQQTQAANLATEIMADLRQVPSAVAIAAANPVYSSKSPKYGIDAAGTGSTVFMDESGVAVAAAQARYKAVVSLTQPSAGQRTATFGSVIITWPVSATVPAGTVSTYVALDRN